jgi:hypothetical protein
MFCYNVFNNPRTRRKSESTQTIMAEITNHITLLPDPATKSGVRKEGSKRVKKEHTFAMDPQERRRPLPLFEYTALEKPRRGSFVVSLACDVMVRRAIRGREPILQFLS